VSQVLLAMQHFMGSLEMVVRETEKRNAESDHSREGQEDENEQQWSVHLMEMERHDLAVGPDVFQCRVIPGPNCQGCQAQSDQ
jgi:hypothetical protein